MHSITFKNHENSWKNALPMGNGVFGAMVFYENKALHIPMNHYEIYYNINEKVLPEDILKATADSETPGLTHKWFYDRAEHNKPKENEPFYYYRLDKTQKPRKCVAGFSGSYPSTGELRFEFDENVTGLNSLLALDIEDAKIRFSLGDKLRAETITAREDIIITKFNGSGVKSLFIEYPASRDRDYPEVIFKEIDSHTFAYTVDMPLGETKRFKFAGIIRLVGAFGKLCENKIDIAETKEEFTVITGVFTEWQYKNPLSDGISKIEDYSKKLTTIYNTHADYWKEFFTRSSINIPDKFLERIYFVNQYALDCSSGQNGVMKHHACGLNGLWDIRHPNLWGSMWYWDVNIQAAFAGVFSSNRLELGKVFSDGLLSYVALAEKFAKNTHNMSGVALDYPYTMYYSTWPWCAQYLFAQYEYSQDKEYLKNEAYPLFLKLCEFALQLFKFDTERGEYVVYPDISPEQGPLSHNTVITVSSVKYMLEFTLESARILGEDSEFLDKCRALLKSLPKYATTTDEFGTRFKDSEDAPPNLWIRHPSMLMPVFPTGEIDITSEKELIETAKNTIRFLEDNCEIGVFQVSWLAAAAARLGYGQQALRLLYEMGIDHLLRSNGLAAEENERFMNYCLIMRQPLYYPCMMEFTGEMLAAVNEMLMQSNGGVIRIFPAMPDGNPEYDRMIRHGYSLDTYNARTSSYPAWRDVSFDKLLARGAFEVSAQLKNGEVTYLKIKSKAGKNVKITSPFSLAKIAGSSEHYNESTNTLEFETELCGEYCFGEESKEENASDSDVITHLSYTKRRITIGENEDTEYYRSIDSFTRDWYLGNVRMENHTVYKFDFGTSEEKDYSNDLPYLGNGAEKMFVGAMGFNRLSELAFTVKRGFGFSVSDNISVVDRGAPDAIRRDFLEGVTETEFMIEAPRGQYEILVISGDAMEESVTILECDDGRRLGGEIVKKNVYQCKLIPLIHEKDGLMKIKISTKDGYKWKLNALLLNLYKQF